MATEPFANAGSSCQCSPNSVEFMNLTCLPCLNRGMRNASLIRRSLPQVTPGGGEVSHGVFFLVRIMAFFNHISDGQKRFR
jgi:hypothetical protein